jgi:SAM-dependent methyltransferase
VSLADKQLNRLAEKILNRFLRLFFKYLYNQFAFMYDLVAITVSAGRWTQWVTAIIPYIKGTALLEIGFGPGHLQKALYEHCFYPAGLDASRWMANITHRRLGGHAGLSKLCLGYAQNLPFSNASIDQVLSTFPSEYIFDPQSLREIHRVLHPNGELLIIPGAWITGSSHLDRLLAGLFRITGQAPHWNDRFARPFLDAHFTLETIYIDLGNSTVLLLRASKQHESG